MKPNKKKPRIRNRPRNKANRQKLFGSENDGQPTVVGVVAELKGENPCEHVNDTTSDSEDSDMPDLEDEAATKTSKMFYIPEEDEAMKTIQRLMRDRIEIQQQMCAKTDTVVQSVTAAQAKEKDTPPVTTISSVTSLNAANVVDADIAVNSLQTIQTDVADTAVKPVTSVETLVGDSLTSAQAVEANTSVNPLATNQAVEADTKAKPVTRVKTLVADSLTSAQAVKADTAVNPLATNQAVEADTKAKPVTRVKTLVKDSLTSAQAVKADTAVKPTTSSQTEGANTVHMTVSDKATKPVMPAPKALAEKAATAAKPVTSVRISDADASAKALTSAQAAEAVAGAAKRSISKQSAENRKETKSNASLNQKSSKSKGKPVVDANTNPEQNAFIQNIQKKMEAMMANGDENLPNTLMENLKKLFDQGPVSDIESDSDGDEYVEYIYTPRKYFMVALCNLCKCDLCKLTQTIECAKCHMTYYCTKEHMQNDAAHRQLCCALQQVAAAEDGEIFQKCSDMTADQFRSYRIITIRKVEAQLNRPLSATEQEVILFPRLCMNAKCRQSAFNALRDCPNCGMVAFCAEQPEHLTEDHQKWCGSYQLFKEFVIFQEQFGKLDPSLPTRILKDTPLNCCTTKQIFCKLGFDLPHNCEYAALTQISTAPLTAWNALKLCDQLKWHLELTIHLIGAEIEFEVDVLHKWELFFLHITPTVQNLNVVFVGPELNPNNILLEQFQKTKCCIGCRKSNRSVKYFFESSIYHDYCRAQNFLKPNLICFFNAGLYRSTGYNMEDTWPETIAVASNLHVPIVVTAYTEYESPLDMRRFLEECQRELKTIQQPAENPFASVKPERNFISDNDAPLMFKNFFFFVVE